MAAADAAAAKDENTQIALRNWIKGDATKKNSSAKKELLQYLVMTGSDEVWEIIDSALDGDQ